MRILSLALSVFVGCTGTYSLSAQYNSDSIDNELPHTNTLQDKIYILNHSWSELKYNFVNIDRIGFDMDSLYFATLDRVLETENDVDFYAEIRRFFAAFNDGHTQLLRTNFRNRDYIEDTPAEIREWDKRFYITTLKKNSGIDSALLGAEIIEIDGIPVKQYVETNYLPYIAQSTESTAWKTAAKLMQQGKPGMLLKGKVIKSDGEIVPFEIPFNSWATNHLKEDWLGFPVRRTQRFDLKFMDRIIILTMGDFAEDMIRMVDSAMRIVKAERAEGLIVDLREGSGGGTDVAWRLQMYMNKSDSFLSFGYQTRINNGYGRAQGNWREEYEPFYLGMAYENNPPEAIYREKGIEPLDCPVVILIGGHTFSVCEDLLINLYEVPDRPLFIGEETAGSTGSPLVIYFPHSGYARICTLRALFPYSGKPFVGEGIKPDIVVKETFEDYANGSDPVMAEALSVITEKSGQTLKR